MTGRTMISNRSASRRRRRGPLVLSLLLCAACLQALRFPTFVGQPSLTEQRVAGGLSQHVFDGHLSSIRSPAWHQRQQSSVVRTARGGGLISWLRGRGWRGKKVPEAEAEAPAVAEEAPEPSQEKSAEGMEEAPSAQEDTIPFKNEAMIWDLDENAEITTTEAASAKATGQDSEAMEKLLETEDDVKVQQLRSAFDSFDLDGSGKIDRRELESAAKRLGKSNEQIGALLTKFSQRGDNEIDFKGFQKMFKELEEQCDVTEEVCFKLDDPSTWGKMFEFNFN